MPKSSRKQIDEDEKKVIRELQKNSKESIDTIAKKCGFSRQKVWRIIKRLEKNKTIWGYHAVIDDEKIDMKSYIMLIKRSNMPMDDFIDKVIKESKEDVVSKTGVEVNCYYYLHGCYDWIIHFTAKDIRDAKKFAESVNIDYAGAVSEIHILENIFPAKACGIVNPEIDKLKDFF
jgi:DNA-binding Lrp family transcriptional regulator